MTDQGRLANAIELALNDQTNNSDDPGLARQQISNLLAAAIINEIKSIQILYQTGLIDGTGKPVTGFLNYTIS